MPIVSVQFVASPDTEAPAGAARALAQALAEAFGAPEGRVWVKLERLDAHLYAENGSAETPRPVFVTVLHADLPPVELLAVQALEVARAVAGGLGCSADQVHVEYAPPGRGRVAFGGRLLR